MEISLGSSVRRSPEIVLHDLDGAAVLLHPEKDTYFGVNRVGCRIWELIEEPQLVEALVAALMETFDVQKEQCEQETLMYLQELNGNALIQVEG